MSGGTQSAAAAVRRAGLLPGENGSRGAPGGTGATTTSYAGMESTLPRNL